MQNWLNLIDNLMLWASKNSQDDKNIVAIDYHFVVGQAVKKQKKKWRAI